MALPIPASLLRRPSFAALVGLTWLLVASALLLQYWPQTAFTLLDTDDALRLVQLRDWLGGKGWFDLHQPRMQPPEGYDTHWSRLIDVGLAGLLWLFNLAVDDARAERLMRAWWPLLWLLPTIAGMAAITWRLAGREAATVSLLLALVGVPAYQQFIPGRIDHHNVQIALTMLTVAATAWSDRWRWGSYAAGALTGLALTIGFESAPYVVGCGAAIVLRYVFDRAAAPALAAYGWSVAASSLIGFFATIGSQHWLRHSCDSIAVNTVAAIVCAGLVLVVAARSADMQRVTRATAVTAAGTAGLAALLLIEPACVRGPFALTDPAIRPIWLGEVRELQPLLAVFRQNPLTASGIAAFPAVAAVSAAILLTDGTVRRDPWVLVGPALFAIALAVTLVAIRGYSYAIWLGMPIVAIMAARLFTRLRLRSMPARLAAVMMLTPMAVSSGAITIAYAAGFDDRDPFDRPDSKACLLNASYDRLAHLPPGLVATDISYGPFLLALTPHAVLAGPYHHLSRGIVAAHRSLSEPPERAHAILVDLKVDYVMVCGERPPDGLDAAARHASLWAQLRAGAVPPWLERIDGDAGEAFAVYRVRR